MTETRTRVWGVLASFLADVQRGDTVTALEEAQIIARASPAKEKVRLKREADRQALRAFRDMEAYRRLTDAGYTLRIAFQKKREAARANLRVLQKAQAIRLVLAIHGIMVGHAEGWTLMLGMPSPSVLAAVQALPDSAASMEGAVAAEVRRFHRAVGMSTWEIVMAHNRQVGSLSPELPDYLDTPDHVQEQALFEAAGYVPKVRWLPGGKASWSKAPSGDYCCLGASSRGLGHPTGRLRILG